MRDIVRRATGRPTGTSTPRRHRTATTPADEATGRLLEHAILPVSQYFAYLEVGEAGQSGAMPDSPLWTLYERLRAAGRRSPCAR